MTYWKVCSSSLNKTTARAAAVSAWRRQAAPSASAGLPRLAGSLRQHWHHRSFGSILIALRRTPLHRQDIAGFGLAVEMQLDQTSVELPHDLRDSLLDRQMIRAVAGDELLDDGPAPRATVAWQGCGMGLIYCRSEPLVTTSRSSLSSDHATCPGFADASAAGKRQQGQMP